MHHTKHLICSKHSVHVTTAPHPHGLCKFWVYFRTLSIWKASFELKSSGMHSGQLCNFWGVYVLFPLHPSMWLKSHSRYRDPQALRVGPRLLQYHVGIMLQLEKVLGELEWKCAAWCHEAWVYLFIGWKVFQVTYLDPVVLRTLLPHLYTGKTRV